MAIDPLNLAGTAKLTFKAAFVSLSLWNGTSGTWATDYFYDPIRGNGGTNQTSGEQEWYINANYPPTQSIVPWTIVDNRLRLTLDTAPQNLRPLINNYAYTSGEINTFHTFSQTYGYFEMRAKVPAVYGLWSAFWLKRENGDWPPELDIMEVLGRDPATLHVNLHTKFNSRSGPGTGNISESWPVPVPDTSLAFHTYGVDWEANTITWYFDRQPVYLVDTTPDMHRPMFIQANLAGGGTWARDVDVSKLPASFEIDYIKAYSALPAGLTHDSPPHRPGGVREHSKGKTLVANDEPGEILKGTPRDDTFYAGNNSVVMEGRGGRDLFVFNELPVNPGQITDFNPLLNRIDVTALLASVNYKGNAPFSDGLFAIMPTLEGGSTLHFYPRKSRGNCCDYVITTLDNVLPSELDLEQNFIVE